MNWASPPWNARIVSAPEFRTLIFRSTPCLTKIPFSTPTNSGTWFMLLTVARVNWRGACPRAAGAPPISITRTPVRTPFLILPTACIAAPPLRLCSRSPARSAPAPPRSGHRLEVHEHLRGFLHRPVQKTRVDRLGQIHRLLDPSPVDHGPLDQRVRPERVRAEPRIELHVGDRLPGRCLVQALDPPRGDLGGLDRVAADIRGRLDEPPDQPVDDRRMAPDELLGPHHVQVVPEIPASPEHHVGAVDLLQNHRPVGLPW